MRKFDLKYIGPQVKYIAGTDEAGRGPLAGPVVAAAVIFDNDTRIYGVRDSKLLDEDEREAVYQRIVKKALSYGVCAVSHGEIDRINILQASLRAMRIAVQRLKIQPDIILVDGNKIFPYSVPTIAIVDGDNLSFTIAAASIIAKVTRDRIMRRLCPKFPNYNWSSNKGYATPEHIRAIREFGPCCLHRKTFLGKIMAPDFIPEMVLQLEPED